jgi:glycosyltransferase involved in cell wall biosynthesis
VKILHLVQKPQLRGAEIFASQLSTHLNNNGCQAMMISLFHGNSLLPFGGKIIHLEGKIRNRFWDVRAWKKLAEIINAEQPDVIQANAGFTLKFAVFSKWLFGWKQPIVFRNASTLSLYIKSSAAKKWNNLFFAYTSRIVSVSHTCAMDFVKLYPKYHDRVCTIPVGIEESVLPFPDIIANEAPLLIHVGGFTFEKNHVGLISIFEKLLKTIPAAKLWLVGDGPLRKEIENLCRQKKLENQVSFLGYKTNVMELIRRADLLVLPSIIEGLPATILEAFYCKVPVVAYDIGGINEIVTGNVTGWRIKLNDEDAFIKAILEGLNKSILNKSIVENAHQLVMQRYLNKSIAEKFMNVYRSVINADNDYQLQELN